MLKLLAANDVGINTLAVGLWLCIKQLERNSYMYLNVTPRGWEKKVSSVLWSHSSLISGCVLGKTAAVTHSWLLVRDHTVKEVIVLEQKTGFSGQMIRAIMQGQGFIVCGSEAHGGGRALLLLFGWSPLREIKKWLKHGRRCDLTKAELEAALCSEKGDWAEKLDINANYTHANIKNLVYH